MRASEGRSGHALLVPWVPLHFIPQPDVRERSDELIWRMWDAAVSEMDKQEQS